MNQTEQQIYLQRELLTPSISLVKHRLPSLLKGIADDPPYASWVLGHANFYFNAINSTAISYIAIFLVELLPPIYL